MKNLPEHEPKSSSWDKIMQQKDFDLQLGKNINQLPFHNPSDITWEKIEKQLDRERRVFLWKPSLIAASIAGLLLLSIFLLTEQSAKEDTLKSISESNATIQSPEIKHKTPIIPDSTKTTTSDSFLVNSSSIEIKKKRRESENIPHVSIRPTLEIEGKLALQEMNLKPRGTPKVGAEDEEKNYHSVAISWGLNRGKLQVRTNFGARDSLFLESSDAQKSELQARIRLQRKNITNKTN